VSAHSFTQEGRSQSPVVKETSGPPQLCTATLSSSLSPLRTLRRARRHQTADTAHSQGPRGRGNANSMIACRNVHRRRATSRHESRRADIRSSSHSPSCRHPRPNVHSGGAMRSCAIQLVNKHAVAADRFKMKGGSPSSFLTDGCATKCRRAGTGESHVPDLRCAG
jgi:hypothetical protein